MGAFLCVEGRTLVGRSSSCYSGVSSSVAGKKAEAASICTSYEEDGIRGWRTFTTEEAKEFREQYSSTIVSLSEMLRKMDWMLSINMIVAIYAMIVNLPFVFIIIKFSVQGLRWNMPCAW